MKKPKKLKVSDDVKVFDSESDNEFSDYEDIDNDESDSDEVLEKLYQLNENSEESSEDEVFPIHSDSESSEDEATKSDSENNNISESDISGGEDDLPDSKAWGTKKKNFYNADRINDKNDYLNEDDEEAAIMEEEEARAIQKRLLSEIDNADLSFDLLSDVIASKKEQKTIIEKENIEIDLSQMGEQEKLKLLKKECPEFLNYMHDYTRYMICVRDELLPVLTLLKEKKLDQCNAYEFLKIYYQLIMNYCTNIIFFILLKTRKSSTKLHPVNKWLSQYKSVLNETEPIYLKLIKSHVESKQIDPVKLSESFIENELKPRIEKNNLKKLPSSIKNDPFNLLNEKTNINLLDQSVVEKMSVETGENEETENKRPITYQIAKNKGLTPHRKKELRNPRVKHRMKYRKAKIRRKGQIREVRKELKKYSGEISGIKATIVKSIKFKN